MGTFSIREALATMGDPRDLSLPELRIQLAIFSGLPPLSDGTEETRQRWQDRREALEAEVERRSQ